MEKPSSARIALKWGIIASVGAILLSVILYVSGLWTNSWLGSLTYVILAVCIFMGMKEYKVLNNGYLNYGEGLGLGTLISAVLGILSGIFQYIYMNFVDKTIPEKILEIQRTAMEERGMTEEQIDQGVQMSANFMSPGMMFLFSVLGVIFIGFIISLIVSAIQKNTKPQIEF